MPIDYSKYPPNWRFEIRPAILKRAGNKCERCGVKNYAIGYREKSGKFVECEGLQADAAILDGDRVIRIVLTVAHLDHDIGNSSPENLAALCQKCHLEHDREQHKATRQKNRFLDKPELFDAEDKKKISQIAKLAEVTDEELTDLLAYLTELSDYLKGQEPKYRAKGILNEIRRLVNPTDKAIKEAEKLGIYLHKKQEK